jgi:ABC-type glycerol-3-phosphate transport system substrate-binding protein
MQKLDLRLVIFGSLGLFVIFIGLVIAGVVPGLKKSNENTALKGSVVLWTVGEESREREVAWKNLLGAVSTEYPGIKVTRKNFRTLSEYESALQNSFGSGETPDVFMVENVALPRYANKIVPANTNILSLETLRNSFPKIVEQDFAPQGKIYGLPLSIDTLALIYNRSLIDQAAISVPKTWEEFQTAIPTLTKSDVQGIQTAGAAFGTSQTNIENAPDILSLLMLQTGVKMTDSGFVRATFANTEGEDALRFYTQFADRNSTSYTWNETMPNAFDFFAQEKVGMLLGYRRDIQTLQNKNSFLDIGVSEVPAPTTQVQNNRRASFARYFSFVVSRETENPDIAWIFVRALTTNENGVGAFLTITKEPPALRSLALLSKDDPTLGVFSRQALTATSWPQIDNRLVERTFSDVIRSVNENRKGITQALDEAQDLISQAMQK